MLYDHLFKSASIHFACKKKYPARPTNTGGLRGSKAAALQWCILAVPCGHFPPRLSGAFGREHFFVFLLSLQRFQSFCNKPVWFWAPSRSLCAWSSVVVCCLQWIFEKKKKKQKPNPQHDALLLSSWGTDGRIVRLPNFNSSHLICRLNEYWAMLAWVRCNEYT